MKYQEYIGEIKEELGERLELVMLRISSMTTEEELVEPYGRYFRTIAGYASELYQVWKMAWDGALFSCSIEELEVINQKLNASFLPEQYEHCYANPAYAVQMLGEAYGQSLAMVFAKLKQDTREVFAGNCRYLCYYAELIVELYNYFEDMDELSPKMIQECIYSFMHDYSEIFAEDSVERLLNPDYDFDTRILMNADLTNPAYLYQYGLFVGENERKSSAFLNTFSDEEVQAMADTYTEGYRIGFEVCNKDITKKSVVEIRYPIGFERMIRVAVCNFERMNLKAVVKPYSTSVNKQFDYDHKEDAALWLDKAYVEYRLECLRNAFEKNKEIAPLYGGPAVVEVFGEEPFAPIAKEENVRFNEKQQQLFVHFRSENSRMTNAYIRGEERSFTIIAYPIAAIGQQYEAIFAETVKINTLDYALYRDMQQKIIDVLDTAERVHIVGANGNRTDLYVKIYDLKNPNKETAFENCVADVNIPVGEVFTSPVLEGTQGKLHVSQVYLNELNYKNLELDFKDGMIVDYTCTNFESEEENKKYIKDNVLFHHDTLPMGEFAIGTNTTAYRVAREYDIAAKMPILIAEKTGPHFAVGDTCYTYDEDNMTYNPDGKAIVARDNSISAQRKTDLSKAYFNCHTDITIPYDELGAITVIRKDGTAEDIIRDGRFVVPGTESLNEQLE